MKFDEYINSLEGKTDLDPVKIAHDLHDIYTQDVSSRDAKIEELNGTIAEKDSAVTAAQGEIQTWKAKNFDLAMQIPGGSNHEEKQETNVDDDGTLTIDDLFVQS